MGADGKGIKSTVITYQASTSGTLIPTGTWQATVPATSASYPYLWTRTIITYTDDTTSTSYAVGSTLEGVSVGGRNLARKTSNEYCAAFNSFNGDGNICPSLAHVYLKGLSVGDKVTVRLVYKYTNIVAVTGIASTAYIQGAGNITEWKSGTFTGCPTIALSGSGEKIIKYSFVITSDMIKNQYWNVNIRHDGIQSGSVQWKEFKVEKGNIATDWTPAPEDGIASVDVEYYLSTSATALSGGSWSTTAPTWVNGKYMWSRTVTTDGAGNKTYSPNQNGVCIAGAKGETGATGATGATGVAGKGVSSIIEQYYKSTSATALSGGSWGTTYPGWENGKYIWTRSVITYTDKTTTTTTAVCVTGTKGSTGNDGKTSYVHIAYANIAYICAENSSFTITSATVCRYGKQDKWVYKTLEAGTYTANSTLFGRDPVNGVVKEVNKITDFSITDSSGRAYMGQYTDFEQAGSNDISKYVWTKVQGAKGETGATGAKGETGATGAPGKDANQVVHSVAGNGNTNQYIEFATVKVIQSYANYATTFKISGREYETTDVQFSFVSVNNTDPGLYFLRATGGFNVWMYKKTTSAWGLVTKLNEAHGCMRVYNFQPGNNSISLTWTDTRYASLPSGCIAADQLQAAKTATNFMEFTSGAGLQIGDKTNGSWKGFRSRITSTAFEILNEAGTAVASYGRKLIQLGKDSVDAIIELCGGKGNIKYATPENNYIQQGLALDRGLVIESVDNIIIKPANKFFVNTELTNSTTDFVGRSSITPGSFQLNVWQSNKGSNIINASVGIEGNIEEGLNLEATGGKYDFLEAIRFNNISLLDWIYPVGSIYMSAKEGNPALLFGGTWVAWGAGRVPVGFNGSDGNFNSSEKTGGSKTINISHSHTVNSHKHIGATGYDNNSYYSGVQWGSAVVPSSGYAWSANWSTATNPIRLSYTSPESPGTNAQLSGSQSILQPYIVCYMWKRTA